MTADNAVLEGGMQNFRGETHRERELKGLIAKYMEKWGRYESVQRLARKYHFKLLNYHWPFNPRSSSGPQ